MAHIIKNKRFMILFWLALAAWAVAQAVLATQLSHFPLDVDITRAWQGLDPEPLEPVLAALNGLEGEVRVAIGVAIVAFGLFHERHRFAACFVVVPLVAQSLNPMVKDLVERPRPSEHLVRVTEHAGGFGFPSGHVMNATIFFGFLCVLAGDVIPNQHIRLLARTACVLIIALMGPARVFTGAHWPSDVVGGYAFGLLVLAVIVWMYRTLRRPSQQLAMTEAG